MGIANHVGIGAVSRNTIGGHPVRGIFQSNLSARDHSAGSVANCSGKRGGILSHADCGEQQQDWREQGELHRRFLLFMFPPQRQLKVKSARYGVKNSNLRTQS
jgi:hypothetical protein